MAEMRKFELLDFLLLVLIFLVAGGVRAGYLHQCTVDGEFNGPLTVVDRLTNKSESGAEQQQLIDNVRSNFWFGSQTPFSEGEETTAHVAPGFPYLVGLLSKYVPDNQAKRIVRWSQVGLGALTAALYFLFARRAFRSLLAGAVAGLFTALHPFWVVEVANLNDVTLASVALAVVLFLASQAGEKGGALTSLLLGAALAGLALVRAAFLPFSFVLLVWFLLRSRTLRLGWLCALCAFLGFGPALSPWTIRNYQEFQEPVPVVSSTYLHLWIGNNAQATGGAATKEMWAEAPTEELQQIKGQPARYARLGKEVIQEIQDRPISTIKRRINATLFYFFGQSWFTDSKVVEATIGEREIPDWIKIFHERIFHAVLLGMMILTFLGWRWSYGWRWESIPAALAMMWVPLPYVLGHAGSMSAERLPLDGVLLCFSAFALCCFVPGVGGYLLAGSEHAPESSPESSQSQSQYA